jgi:tRNA 2-selenouridine synthase
MSRFPEKITFPTDRGATIIGKYDEVIDVRSPSEFQEDHISGAINLPVLNDEERERVGRTYKQVSAFDARKEGAALVTKNISSHLQSHFADKSKDYEPLVYCWRGGQRSGSFATVLSDIGWSVRLIEGGYKTYRSHVLDTFETTSEQLRLVVLNGYTGAGKTLILKALEKMGAQILELEGMANHKGSVFGGDPDHPQPAQKRFESLIYDAMSGFDLEKLVFVEAESAKIGRLNLPNPLWQRMKRAPVIEVFSPLSARATYLTADYEEWIGDPGRIEATLDRLTGFHSKERITHWKTLAQNAGWHELVSGLLELHYDRRYTVGGSGHFEAPSERVELNDHSPEEVEKAAVDLIRKGEAVAGR